MHCSCKDIRACPHETRFALDRFQAQAPFPYRIVSHVSRRNPVLGISHNEALHYRERDESSRTHVVYGYPCTAKTIKLDPLKTHIVMVASINEEKGVELLGKVAGFAHERHPEWQLRWVGGLETIAPIYQYPRVKSHGWHWSPSDIVCQCHVFFNSSIEDPCPPSAIEALQSGKRCVAYRETGTAELISSLHGCAVFNEHTAEAALEAIESALTADSGKTATIASEISAKTGLEAFKKSIDRILK